MKPITFENLRRLVGGGRKKKEKESSFKRSDSFKRISIRKSYLDRGKKKHLQKLEVATQTVSEEVLGESSETQRTTTVKKVDSSVQVDKIDLQKLAGKEKSNKEGPGQSVIAYGQWLKGIRKDEPNCAGVRGAERTIIYVPACDDEDNVPTPVIRQLSSSPVFRKRSPILERKVLEIEPQLSPSPTLQRKESNDSAVEMFPWGHSSDTKKSPRIKRRSRPTTPLLPDSGAEEMCSLSISLGRIWMDAPQNMAPRSLEMPRSSSNQTSAHHSLDSALKELRDDPIVINRLQKRSTPPVGRTLSSTSNTTVSTGLFSSKDSGFSFSIPKLSEDNNSSKGGFFKKKPKPKLSVSREGYFKRTSGALIVERNSIRRRSSRKKKLRGSTRKKNSQKFDMYQVVVSRPRCLKNLKLDPMIFVPPEKRKSVRKKPSFKLGLREIRNCPPRDAVYSNGSADEGLYESLPGDVDDFSDDQPLSGRISRISLREEDEVYPSGSYFSLDDPNSTTDDNSNVSCSGNPYASVGVSPTPRRKPVRRKRSGLSRKKSITYVAKPIVKRAPSTLRKAPKKNGK
ncbi:hypothetical protein MML48_1g00794 [Holotrichia oblita]|uniref:Uncharacterized protein n=1 Tax=Holotrichia oblita TaxID=644536 RepID=A0ACB9TYN8_HOLOL|nr:hypothetical protein MML48_1g00794 [Holotrichia oblita]